MGGLMLHLGMEMGDRIASRIEYLENTDERWSQGSRVGIIRGAFDRSCRENTPLKQLYRWV